MAKRLLSLVLLTMVVFGCSSDKLRPDASLSSIKAGYSTAEFFAVDGIHHGLAMFAIEEGDELSDLKLAVRGYHEGSVVITSDSCNDVDKSVPYQNSALIPIGLEGPAVRSCLVTVVVTPIYSSSTRGSVTPQGFRGHIAVKVIPHGERWKGAIRRVSGSWVSPVSVPAEGQEARVVLKGCGVDYSALLPVQNGAVVVPLEKAVAPGKRLCVLDGFFVSDTQEGSINVLVEQFDSKYNVLPMPIVEIDDDKIKVKGDPAVSILALNGKYEIDYKGKFDFDPSKQHVLRALTSAGRSVIGVWDPVKKVWKWMQ